MIGTFLAVMVVFAILVVASRSLGYLRGRRFSVADSDVTAGSDVRRSAAVGAGSGLLVLLLIAALYTGITRWDWLGHPVVSHIAVASPLPISSPGSGAGFGVKSPPPAASPAASPSASPSP
jgi:hypothetical protein